MTRLIINEQVYEEFLLKEIPGLKKFLWIATADIKDVHVQRGRSYIPFLRVLSELTERGVEIRLLHAKEPGERFRRDFDRYPGLARSELFERILCPRVHFKCLILDGKRAYIGSANLTGAGMGAKNTSRRNFEAGMDTRDPALLDEIMTLFDEVFLGDRCAECSFFKDCPDPAVHAQGA